VASTKGLIASFLGFLKDQGLYHADYPQRDERMFYLYFWKKKEIRKEKETPLFKWFWCAVWSSAQASCVEVE